MAFVASHHDATAKDLKRNVSELQDQRKYLQSAETTRGGSYGGGA
jgi:hypothetical protein